MKDFANPSEVLEDLFSPNDKVLVHALALFNLIGAMDSISIETRDAAYYHYLKIKAELDPGTTGS